MKKKIKIIDIFCKINCNEEVPYKIKYDNLEYTYNSEAQDYDIDDNCNYLFEHLFEFQDTSTILETEVEILDNIPSPDNYVPIEKQMKNDNFTGGKWYIDGKEIMSMEIDNKEDEFEDIEEIELGNVSPNGEYIISVKEEKIQDKINQLIKNQKKIIERLKEEGK